MIVNAFCNNGKKVFLETQTYKIALYKSVATLNKNTSAYTTSNEVSGQGYIAGGKELMGKIVTLDGDVACLDFDDPIWKNSTISAGGALIYISSLPGNPAVASFTFGEMINSTNGDFKATLPIPNAETALIRIG